MRFLARAALVACAAFSLTGSALVDPSAIGKGGADYKTAQVQRGTLLSEMTASGSVYRPTYVDIRCKVYDARVAEVALTRAEIIEKGTYLGLIRSESSRADLAQTSLSLDRAEEALIEQTEQREEAIRKKQDSLQGLSAAEREIAELEMRKMQIELEDYILRQERTIADLTEKEAEQTEQMEDKALYAPVTGSVAYFSYIMPGESLAYDQVLLTLQTSDPTLIRIEDEEGKWRYGMEVQVEYGSRSNLKTVKGRVISADNVLSATDATGYAYVQLEKDIPAEDLTQVKVHGEEIRLENVLLVSRNAHALYKGQQQASILDGASIARRYISAGFQDKNNTWVLQGLEEGQTVIVN